MTPMDRERWLRVERLFHEVLDRPEKRRAEWLAEACGDDDELRRQVLDLLAADTTGSTTGPGAAGSAVEQRTGSRVGPYTLLRPIGRGGMGAVYAAARADEGFERRVAVKLLRHGPLSDELRSRFDRERRILARLEHPHIARLLDGGTDDDGSPYLVLELVDGEPIDRWCAAQGLPPRRRLALFLEVCRAVGAAHRRLVVHRDLKPSNILVTAEGEPKLLDFGISELLDGGTDVHEPEVDRNAPRLRPLTPGYASPEHLAGAAGSTASDVFSLGVVLYELLCGRLPFSAEELAAMAFDGEADGAPPAPPPLAGKLRLRFAADIDAILARALAARPEDRYRSVDELADDVARYLERRPVHAAPGGWGRHTARFAVRHRWGLAAASVLAALLTGLLTLTALLALERGRQRDRMRAERDRARVTADFVIRILEQTSSFGERSETGEILAQGGERLLATFDVDADTRSALHLALGRLLTSFGRYEDARPHLEEAVAMRRAAAPERPLERAEAEHLLARLLNEAGDYDRAEELERSAVAALDAAGPRAANDSEALSTRARSLSNLGWLLALRGEHEEAERLLTESLELSRRLWGERNGRVADRLDALAFARRERGDLENARRLYREALAIRRQVVPADHPGLAMSLKNLAAAEIAAGDHEAAGEALEEALRVETANFGERHPATAGTLDKLGAVRLHNGDLDGAAELIERALEIRRETLGELHPRVSETLARRAEVRWRQGDLVAAAETAAESVAVARASVPEGSPMVAFPLTFQARIERQRGDTRRAEALLREALERRLSALGPASPLTAGSRLELASLFADSGRPAEARRLLEENAERLADADGQAELIARGDALIARLPASPPG